MKYVKKLQPYLGSKPAIKPKWKDLPIFSLLLQINANMFTKKYTVHTNRDISTYQYLYFILYSDNQSLNINEIKTIDTFKAQLETYIFKFDA